MQKYLFLASVTEEGAMCETMGRMMGGNIGVKQGYYPVTGDPFLALILRWDWKSFYFSLEKINRT